MVNKELLDKVKNLYLDSKGVIVNNHYKKKVKIYKTDSTKIEFSDDKIIFEFDEDYYKNFKILTKDIFNIQFDIVMNMTISVIELNDGRVVLIHNL